jgi:hypothetical protein
MTAVKPSSTPLQFSAKPTRRAFDSNQKRSNSAAGFWAFDPLSPTEAAFRQNVMAIRHAERVPKNG